jgi:hypothetical protein
VLQVDVFQTIVHPSIRARMRKMTIWEMNSTGCVFWLDVLAWLLVCPMR